MTIVQSERRFHTHDRESMAAWWDAVQESGARATLMMEKGSRVYVTESFAELARTPQDLRFLEVHVVSVATGSMYEADRIVNGPALRRLIPADKVANIAPITDAEISVAL